MKALCNNSKRTLYRKKLINYYFFDSGEIKFKINIKNSKKQPPMLDLTQISNSAKEAYVKIFFLQLLKSIVLGYGVFYFIFIIFFF